MKYLIAIVALFGSQISSEVIAETSPDILNNLRITEKAIVPSITALRIEGQEKIIVDGKMNEQAWQLAESTDQFYQSDPDEGAQGTERTQVRILYDQDNLYFFIEAFDSQPENIIAKNMTRDVVIAGGDTVSIKLDSMNSKQNAYTFTTNPAAVKIDAIIENNTTVRTEWDTIWDVATSITALGWTAEFSIPVRSISYNNTNQSWGLQINRIMSRKNERVRWASPDRSISTSDTTKYGALRGIKDLNESRGIEAQIFASGFSNKTANPVSNSESDMEVSGDIRYRLTPKLTASATINTDFSDTPLDSRQINTGRFSLFFPETRDFFLQDAAVFEFGGQVFHDGYWGDRNGIPFFSRNIGLVGSENPNLDIGVKLSGELGPVNIGVLSTHMDQTDLLASQSLSTLRISSALADDTKIGLVATQGDPRGEIDQLLLGIDYQYRHSLENGGTFTVDSAFVQGSGDDQADGSFAGLATKFRNDDWQAMLRVQRFGEDYNPRLGFTNRTGITRYNYIAWRFWRPDIESIRLFDLGVQGTTNIQFTGDGNDRRAAIFANVTSPSGHWFHLDTQFSRTDVDNLFSIAGLLQVEPTSYQYKRVGLRTSSAPNQPFKLSFNIECCEMYDGTNLSTSLSLYYQPSAYFDFQIHHIYNEFKLPTGALDFHITNTTAGISFSPKLQFSIQMQHDSISDRLSFFGRLFYEIAPTMEGFVGIGHTAAIQSEDYVRGYEPLETGFAIRLGQTLRF